MGDGGAGAMDAFRLPEERFELYHPFANGLILKYGSTPGLLDGTVGVTKSSFHKADTSQRSVQVLYFVVADPGGNTLVAMRAVLKDGMEIAGRLGKAMVMDQLECAELFRRQGLATTLITFVSDMAQHNDIELFSRCQLDVVSFWAKRGFEVEGDSQVLGFCHNLEESVGDGTVLMRAGQTFYRYYPGGSAFDSSLQPFYHRAEETDDDELPATTEESSTTSSGRDSCSCSGEETSVRKRYEDDIELTSSTASDVTSHDEGSPSSRGVSPVAESGGVRARASTAMLLAGTSTAVGHSAERGGMVMRDIPPLGTLGVGRNTGSCHAVSHLPSVTAAPGVSTGCPVYPGGGQWAAQKPLGMSEKLAIEALTSLPSEGSPSALSFDDVVAKVGSDMDDDSALAMAFAMSLGEESGPGDTKAPTMHDPGEPTVKGSGDPGLGTGRRERNTAKQPLQQNIESIGQAPWGAPVPSPSRSPSPSPSPSPSSSPSSSSSSSLSSVSTVQAPRVTGVTVPTFLSPSLSPCSTAQQPQGAFVDRRRQSAAGGRDYRAPGGGDARPGRGGTCLGKRGRGCRGGERPCSSRKCSRRLRKKKGVAAGVGQNPDPGEDGSNCGQAFSATEGGIAAARAGVAPGDSTSPPGSIMDIEADVVEGGSALVSMSRANDACCKGDRVSDGHAGSSDSAIGSGPSSNGVEHVASSLPPCGRSAASEQIVQLDVSLTEGWATKSSAGVTAEPTIEASSPSTNDSPMVSTLQSLPQGVTSSPSAVAPSVGHGVLGTATPPDLAGGVNALGLPPVPSNPVPMGNNVEAVEFNSAGSFTGDVGVGVGVPEIKTDEEKNLAFLHEAGVEPEEAKAMLSYDAAMEVDGMGSLGSLLAAASWEGDASSQEAEHMRQALEASRRCHEEEMMKRAKEASREEAGRTAGIRIASHVAEAMQEPLAGELDVPGEQQVLLTRKGKLRRREE